MSDERLPLHKLYCKTSVRRKQIQKQKQDGILDLIRHSPALLDIKPPVEIDGSAAAAMMEKQRQDLSKRKKKKQTKKKKEKMKKNKKQKKQRQVKKIMASIRADPDYTLVDKAMQALHILQCKRFAERDPREKALVATRVAKFNTALFDLDEESKPIHWPLFQDLPVDQWHRLAGSSLNIISLKMVESCVSYPIKVYGTVLARDAVDFKCIYLFRREMDDPQEIKSKDDMLTLSGPHRGFIISDNTFFEINLKMTSAPGIPGEDFSKGVLGFCGCALRNEPISLQLTSWWSKVKLVCTPVAHPVEATLGVKILKGPVPFDGQIIAWTDGNETNDEYHMVLYNSNARGTQVSVGAKGSDQDGVSVALSRNLVAVPVPIYHDEKYEIGLTVCFVDTDGKREVATLRYPMEEKVCKLACYDLQVKVTWRAMTTPELEDMRWYYMPRAFFMSWLWMVHHDH